MITENETTQRDIAHQTAPSAAAPSVEPPRIRLHEAVLEWFGDEAVAFIVAVERFVTLDRAGGEILTLAHEAFGTDAFTPADLGALLERAYELLPPEAEAAARRLTGDWRDCGLLVPA